jgi:RNA polymerase sigma factor (TIGR02999 family)
MPGEVDFSAVYDELRRIAAGHLARGVPHASIQPTILVHEAWLRLNHRTWNSKTHFLALASRAMRLILIDAIRARGAQKRPGPAGRQEWPAGLEFATPELTCPAETLLDLNRALEELEAKDARKAKVVEMRFFGGLEFSEIADSLEVSLITAKRDWEFARAWLYSRLARSGLKSPDNP